MDMRPNARQAELIAKARQLAFERFEPRAAELDRAARFPFEDYDDLREAGFLALCVPEEFGGLGADLETYCLVSEQLAQGNASTALTFNMHCLTMLMMGEMADAYEMGAEMRARHEELRAVNFREVVEQGVYYGQPHSEPIEEGETDQVFTVGGRRFGTTADKVEGGYRLNGRKFFVSLADAAPYFATPAVLNVDGSFVERTLYLKVPREADGLAFTGEWDPIGMRATVSRAMVLRDVFVPDAGEILPPGVFGGHPETEDAAGQRDGRDRARQGVDRAVDQAQDLRRDGLIPLDDGCCLGGGSLGAAQHGLHVQQHGRNRRNRDGRVDQSLEFFRDVDHSAAGPPGPLRNRLVPPSSEGCSRELEPTLTDRPRWGRSRPVGR